MPILNSIKLSLRKAREPPCVRRPEGPQPASPLFAQGFSSTALYTLCLTRGVGNNLTELFSRTRSLTMHCYVAKEESEHFTMLY